MELHELVNNRDFDVNAEYKVYHGVWDDGGELIWNSRTDGRVTANDTIDVDTREIVIKLKFPYGQPDKNGVIYTKEAVKNALSEGVSGFPIIYVDNNGYESVIGYTKDEQVTQEWDDSNGICNIKVNGIVFFAGTCCIVNEMTDGVVKDFKITNIGISK